ncbi:MAG: hypothetical protein LBF68_04255 [Christensenellaceae bacterium]|jgi:hypothetical protein|nr:hypothetical protein [Christensenellaceae bacterium]
MHTKKAKSVKLGSLIKVSMKNEIEVQGQDISVLNGKGTDDYISLTDMPKYKNPNETALVFRIG